MQTWTDSQGAWQGSSCSKTRSSRYGRPRTSTAPDAGSFAILLQASGDPWAAADRLRQAVSDEPVPSPAGPVPVTVSVGLTTVAPDDNVDGMLARADRCLYRAKQTGRNRVVHDEQ